VSLPLQQWFLIQGYADNVEFVSNEMSTAYLIQLLQRSSPLARVVNDLRSLIVQLEDLVYFRARNAYSANTIVFHTASASRTSKGLLLWDASEK
jgi:hypothetical protein